MKASVYCTTKTLAQAENIVLALKNAGFGSNDISALLPDKRGTKDFAHEHNTKAPEGATAGGVAGLGVGAAVGWLAGIGALIGMGIPEFEAKRYDAKVREGNILISVHTEDSKQRDVAKDIFKRYNADDISTGSEGNPKAAQHKAA